MVVGGCVCGGGEVVVDVVVGEVVEVDCGLYGEGLVL